jgi:hypothetical protein
MALPPATIDRCQRRSRVSLDFRIQKLRPRRVQRADHRTAIRGIHMLGEELTEQVK